jgi:hypothetical protein
MELPSGEWFFTLADLVILDREKEKFHYNLHDVMKNQKFIYIEDEWKDDNENEIIAIYSQFFDSLVDRIKIFKKAKTFIVHNSDATYDKNKVCKWLDENKDVILYAQNLTFEHNRAFVLPIGQANSMWIHGDKTPWLNPIKYKNIDVLVTHCANTNPIRDQLHNLKSSKITRVSYCNYIDYISYIQRSKFVICPPGNGPDTHRLWETIASGAIPIVIKDNFIEQLIRTFPDIPLIICNNYNEVDYENLQYNFPENFNLMNRNYWESRIRGPSIIFTHVGTIAVPEYTKDAIYQARLWNPKNKIILLTNQINFDIEVENFELVDVNKIPKSNYYDYFIQNNRLDINFRNGFWRFTTERIFVLHSYVKYFNIQTFFHLENDNLLYCNINEELNEYVGYKSNKKLMITSMGSKGEHLMNIFCCNDIKSFDILCDFFSKEINTHEMVTIYNFWKIYSNLVEIFPYHPECDSNFIIDAAPIGQYIGGPDPRNLNKKEGSLTPGFRNTNAIFDSTIYKYEWKNDKYKRLYLNNKIVYNLHIHCKVLKEFKS